MEPQKSNHPECCPEFDPSPWDGKSFRWDNKLFVKEKVKTFFYIPLNFGSVMKKIDSKFRESGLVFQEGPCLSYHSSKWSMDLLVSVEQKVSGMENTRLNGSYYSKVYEGPFKNTGKWCEDFKSAAKAGGYSNGKMYMWYTTCPRCAKKYGKNYVVIVGEVS